MNPRSVTAAVLGDPDPDRLERAEAKRLSLPEPRPELGLEEWATIADEASAGESFLPS